MKWNLIAIVTLGIIAALTLFEQATQMSPQPTSQVLEQDGHTRYLTRPKLMTANLQWMKMEEIRPNYKTGYGVVIDDLERHSDGNHDMRNTRDPGNWAHELTHQLHSDLRLTTPAHDNCFYFGKGAYVRLIEPNVTLRQVAGLVDKADRGRAYKTYLVDARRWWNKEPLYVMDEAVANATGLQYHFTTGTEDAQRTALAIEFLAYTQALLKAVKQYDPDYAQLEDLEALIGFHRRWVEGMTEPVGPPIQWSDP